MQPIDVLLVLVAAAVIGVAGLVALRARRVAAGHRAEADRAEAALSAESRSSAGDREVRGLILASMEEGVLLVDHEGDRVFANEALERHLGDAPAKADLLLPTALRDAVRRAGYTGATTRVEVETGAPTRWLKASAQPVGIAGSVLLVVRDVTEARRLDAIRRDFVANASHELKTPVASIRATAETLRDGAIEDPPAARRFTGTSGTPIVSPGSCPSPRSVATRDRERAWRVGGARGSRARSWAPPRRRGGAGQRPSGRRRARIAGSARDLSPRRQPRR
jgi:signal transduction histidine kinase